MCGYTVVTRMNIRTKSRKVTTMKENKSQQSALMRYGVIAPAVCHTLPEGMTLSEFFEEASKKPYAVPGGKPRYYRPRTIETWYYNYQKNGFDGIVRQGRNDVGKSRKIDQDVYEQIKYLKERYPRIPATEILSQLISTGTVRKGRISLSTVTRCVNHIVEENRLPTHADKRRYERPHINAVWCGDSCVGPKITINGEKRRVYIIALIDDASRFITAAEVSYRDDFVSLLHTIKTAVMKYGVPKMFNFDNGHTYRNHQMELLAARITSTIHYCQPYTPTQKSKIERWFRTMRDKWMAITDLSQFDSLEQIQSSLDIFVQNYNHTVHSSLNGMSPDERFFSESNQIRRLPADEADKLFLLEIERRVSADCVITIDNTEYEVDCRYSGTRVCLRYSPDMKTIYLVENGGTLTPIRLLNKQENANIKRNKIYLSGGAE